MFFKKTNGHADLPVAQPAIDPTLDDLCVIASMIAPNVEVPIHSHRERETFYCVSGQLQIFDRDGRRGLSAGDVFDMPSKVEHGLCNVSDKPVCVVLVIPKRAVQFFESIGLPVFSLPLQAPSPDSLRLFVSHAVTYGYWQGLAQDNIAPGIFRFLADFGVS